MIAEQSRAQQAVPRIPLNTLAISLGLAGLASVWSTMTAALNLSSIVPGVLWAGVAVAWVWLITAHLVRGAQSTESLVSQLKHPAQGPIAAIVPTVGLLVGAQLRGIWPVGGLLIAIVSFVLAVVFAGWILAYWHTGHLNPEAFHGAYLLPTVAAPLVGSEVAAEYGFHLIAMGAFAVGIFFWLVLVTVLLARLAFFPPLPGALTPTLAILVAPPAVAGTAWFAINGASEDIVSMGLLGLLAAMAVLQLFLIGIYRTLQFTLGFWSFTFPAAAAATYAIQWAQVSAFTGWVVGAYMVAVGATGLVAAIAIRSLVLVGSTRRGARRAEEILLAADEAAQDGARDG